VPRQSDLQQLGVGHIARHSYLLDWNRTVAYAPLPSGNGIHLVQQSEKHPHGIPAGEYGAFRERLKSELLALRTEDGTLVVEEVWFREEIFAGDQMMLAPDLTLVMQDGGLISILDADEAVETRAQPGGTHRPLGIFLARGPHLQEGVNLPELSILDVAPLILFTLDIEIPAFMEGRLPAAGLEAAGEMRSTLPLVDRQDSEMIDLALDEEAQAKIIERLQRLGYLE
jgi:predicted AlkP superfamily phosphohydrolase/phosphomutase